MKSFFENLVTPILDPSIQVSYWVFAYPNLAVSIYANSSEPVQPTLSYQDVQMFNETAINSAKNPALAPQNITIGKTDFLGVSIIVNETSTNSSKYLIIFLMN